MVTIAFEEKPAFGLVGTKTWISGADNGQFAEFWKAQRENGAIGRLEAYRKKGGGQLGCRFIGLSDTSRDPSTREFFFYAAVEADADAAIVDADFERIAVRGYTWAVFTEGKNTVESLIASEMHCWRDWLPGNGIYVHDLGPEMEVYRDDRIEYWIPITTVAR